MPFVDYSRTEAEQITREFLTLFDDAVAWNAVRAPSAQWTELIVDWWAATVRNDAVVDAHPPKRGKGWCELPVAVPVYTRRYAEFSVDLAHTRFEPYEQPDYGSLAYWQRAYTNGQRPEMLLALESEAGRQNSAPDTLRMVIDDASKLFPLAARLKVVIFASTSPANRIDITQIAGRMVQSDYTYCGTPDGGDAGRPTWVWIDLPWKSWADTYIPQGWIGQAGAPGLVQLRP